MRSWLFVCGSTILFAVTGHTQVTAYAALRTVGSSRGEKVLSQVLAISGEGSGAQPNRWKVWIDDPAARGGVRELEVSGNQITSERTPVKSEWAGGKDMDLAHLNLDSDGAYQVATQEARTKGIEFSKVQFQLAADRETGKPGWTVQLSDAKDQRVGAIKVNADSGTIVSSAWGADAPNLVAQQRTSENSDERFLNSSESQTPAHRSHDEEAAPVAKAALERQTAPHYAQEQEQQSQYQDEPGQYGQSSQSGQQSGSITDRAGNIGRKVVNRVERPFLRAGGWIQKKFTGQDTISPPRTKDDDDDDDDNRSSDQYNKPVHPVPQ
ncbi:MAG TPA: hypothetical protein VE641_19845 [Chthoniobacterales bacterium]|jgi:hypothetical protein|nr:hypothetical protein [Chthoniobacterales bacterium]